MMFQNLQNIDTKQKMFEKYILSDEKPTFKHHCVNKNCQNEVIFKKSEHSLKLQKSRYLMIDDEIKSTFTPNKHENSTFLKGFYSE